MKNNSFKEIVVASTLIVLVVLLLNPFHFYMPGMMVMTILALALVAFGFIASFILREQVGDERDSVHKTRAGRLAFLAGSGVTIIAILVQSQTHSVDPWIVLTLSVMVITKIASRVWSDYNL